MTRLSRKVLTSLAGVAGLAILGSVIWALDGGKRSGPENPKLINTDTKSTPGSHPYRKIISVCRNGPTARAAAPRRSRPAYPQCACRNSACLGARDSGAARGPGERSRPHQPAFLGHQRKRTAGERHDARRTMAAAAAAATLASDQKPPLDPDSLQNMQDRKLAYASGPTNRRTISPDRLTKPASPYALQAGSIVPAALITASNPICRE